MRQAVILAGGQATRLRPYTQDRPKAMVEVAGIPVCEHQLIWLAAAGVEQAVMSVGYRAEVIQDRIGDGSRLGIKVDYAVEETPLGRGGGMKLAAKQLPFKDEGWFAMNGDVLASEEDLARCRQLEAGDHAERRGFAAARWPEQAEERPIGNGEARIFHRDEIAECLVQMLDPDLGHRSLPELGDDDEHGGADEGGREGIGVKRHR